MRLSREKVNLLSHQITDKLASIDEVEFIEDRNTIRLAVVDILIKWLKKKKKSIRPPGKRSRAKSAPFPKAVGSGKSSIVSIMKRKCETS